MIRLGGISLAINHLTRRFEVEACQKPLFHLIEHKLVMHIYP